MAKKTLDRLDKNSPVEALEAVAPDEDIPPKALEAVDLSLPADYENEILAMELLAHISNYRRMELARVSARNQGLHDKAEQLAKEAAYSRTIAAFIQYKYPETKVLYKVLAQREADRLQKARDGTG